MIGCDVAPRKTTDSRYVLSRLLLSRASTGGVFAPCRCMAPPARTSERLRFPQAATLRGEQAQRPSLIRRSCNYHHNSGARAISRTVLSKSANHWRICANPSPRKKTLTQSSCGDRQARILKGQSQTKQPTRAPTRLPFYEPRTASDLTIVERPEGLQLWDRHLAF